MLLDLGAVWCHWCHVMEEITYRDPEVIKLLRSRYIAVRVDQDSRPDLSNRYENYGWPATIVFDASGGEIVKRQGYIPPRPMASMLQAIIDDPTPGPSVVTEEQPVPASNPSLPPESVQALRARLLDGYDSKNLGWGTVHKFLDWNLVEYCMFATSRREKTAISNGWRGRPSARNATSSIRYGAASINTRPTGTGNIPITKSCCNSRPRIFASMPPPTRAGTTRNT